MTINETLKLCGVIAFCHDLYKEKFYPVLIPVALFKTAGCLWHMQFFGGSRPAPTQNDTFDNGMNFFTPQTPDLQYTTELCNFGRVATRPYGYGTGFLTG
jgi:hypothetical protein